MTDTGPGTLLTGINEQGQVVVNLDHDRTGHIIFSPEQARDFADVLAKKAIEAAIPDRDAYLQVPVREAQAISERYRKNVVMIIAFDSAHDLTHATSYGRTALDKVRAASGLDIAMKALGHDPDTRRYYEDFRDRDPAFLAESIELLRSILRFCRTRRDDVSSAAIAQEIDAFLDRIAAAEVK